MSRTKVLMAVALAAVAAPADAAKLFNVSVYGSVSGTQSTVRCVAGSPANCLTLYPSGNENTPYTQNFEFSLGERMLEEGENPFTYGFEYAAGYFQGTIIRTGNVLTGGPISLVKSPGGSCNYAPLGCSYITASAGSFSVTGGVPEPGTWLMMLLGFGAIGFGMRRQRSVTAQLALIR